MTNPTLRVWAFTVLTFPVAALYVVMAFAVSLGDTNFSADIWRAWLTARRGIGAHS